MERIISIDGRDVKLQSTGAYLLRYKKYFGRDAIQDLMSMGSEMEKLENGNVADFNMDILYMIVWTLAKTANPDIPPMIDWVDSFSSFPITEIATDAMALVMASINPTVQPKKK